MYEVAIKPQWTIRHAQGTVLAPRVIELLAHVLEHGSLASACSAIGLSYRHAWELIRLGEAMFGEPLVLMQRGKGSTLTALGEKLVWADRRITARLSPLLDSLASELGAEIEKVISVVPPLFRIHASHGFAVETLHSHLGAAKIPSDLKYCSSEEAVASLLHGSRDVAGFHVPIGDFEAETVAHYAPWFDVASHKVINVATRRQGLMVAAGNPRKIYTLADLLRPGVRFINRQVGSRTRHLFDLQLKKAGIAPQSIKGYEQYEFTHAAIAAFVASGMADVGYGVETPARQFKLDFIADQTERYFLLCDEKSLTTPIVQRVLEVLRGAGFRDAVNALPGYEAADPGRVMPLDEAFVSIRTRPGKKARRP